MPTGNEPEGQVGQGGFWGFLGIAVLASLLMVGWNCFGMIRRAFAVGNGRMGLTAVGIFLVACAAATLFSAVVYFLTRKPVRLKPDEQRGNRGAFGCAWFF